MIEGNEEKHAMNEYIKIGASLAPIHPNLTAREFSELWLHQIDVKLYRHNHRIIEDMFVDYTLALQGYQDTGGMIVYKDVPPLTDDMYLGALIICDVRENVEKVKLKARQFPNCKIGMESDEAELHVRIPAIQMNALKVYLTKMPEVFFVIGEGDI